MTDRTLRQGRYRDTKPELFSLDSSALELINATHVLDAVLTDHTIAATDIVLGIDNTVWRVSDAAGRRPAERKFITFLLLAAIRFPFPGAAAAKQGRELSTSRFRPLNLRVSARANTLR